MESMPFVIISFIGFALTKYGFIGSSVWISLTLGKGKSKEISILFSISLVIVFIVVLWRYMRSSLYFFGKFARDSQIL